MVGQLICQLRMPYAGILVMQLALDSVGFKMRTLRGNEEIPYSLNYITASKIQDVLQSFKNYSRFYINVQVSLGIYYSLKKFSSGMQVTTSPQKFRRWVQIIARSQIQTAGFVAKKFKTRFLHCIPCNLRSVSDGVVLQKQNSLVVLQQIF